MPDLQFAMPSNGRVFVEPLMLEAMWEMNLVLEYGFGESSKYCEVSKRMRDVLIWMCEKTL